MSAHCKTLRFQDGREVLVSYETPVAGFVPSIGWVRTAQRYSVTTSKHINQYLGNTVGKVTVLPQAELSNLFGLV